MENTISYKAYLKSPYKSIKHTTYFEIYDELFCRYRGKNITFVEIGVLGGGSLFMWREFFGPEARIIGVDLNPNAKKWEEQGFEIFIGNQSDKDFWQEFIKKVGPIDIVLDDGGHTYLQQITTTEMLLPYVNDGGIIVVEDTHTSYMSGFGPQRYSFVNYVKNMIDRINYRFGAFNHKNADKRVWSIQSFESIVAFHINKQATNLLSELTNNNGIDDFAKDFRYHKNIFVSILLSKFEFLKHIPGVKLLALNIMDLAGRLTGSTASLKKYFNLN
jgi:hypothetical protein